MDYSAVSSFQYLAVDAQERMQEWQVYRPSQTNDKNAMMKDQRSRQESHNNDSNASLTSNNSSITTSETAETSVSNNSSITASFSADGSTASNDKKTTNQLATKTKPRASRKKNSRN